jgi:hypothetical protein
MRSWQLPVLSLFLFATLFSHLSVADTTSLPPERYELCQTDDDIAALQQQYGLTLVDSVPTNAAMHPGWPETLSSIVFALYSIFVSLNRSSRHDSSALFGALLWPIVVDIAWTIGFAILEREKFTGGWISVEDGATTAIFIAWAFSIESYTIALLLSLFGAFQGMGALVIIIQRWKKEIGTIAYMVVDTNGCTPYNGLGYLEQGARAQNFRILQLVEYLYSGIVINVVWLSTISSGNVDHREMKMYAAVGMMFIFIPVVVYEAIIAVKGTPVVISGIVCWLNLIQDGDFWIRN